MARSERPTGWRDSLGDLLKRSRDVLATIGADVASRLNEDRLEALSGPDVTDADFADALESLEMEAVRLGEAQRNVASWLERIEGMRRRHRYAVRFEAAHWPERRASLEQLIDDDLATGRAEWVEAYVDALTNWELDACRRLVAIDVPFPESWPQASSARDATDALIEGRYDDADEFLAGLRRLDRSDGQPIVDSAGASTIEVLRARLKLNVADQAVDDDQRTELLGTAQELLEGAAELDESSALPHAGLAALWRKKEDYELSLDAVEMALEADPDAPDGHIEEGLWAEALGQPDAASEAFQLAAGALAELPSPVDAAGNAVRGQANLLWLKLADHLHSWGRYEDALTAVRQAYPQPWDRPGKLRAERFELEAEILRRLDRPAVERASAVRSAGMERYWEYEFETACRLFERAISLDPDEKSQYFVLSDSHLRRSFDADLQRHEIRREVSDAHEQWAEGNRRANWEADSDVSWAFMTRALIAQQDSFLEPAQRERSLWQAIVYLDRNLHYQPDAASAWALMARYLRYMGFVRAMLACTERAEELAPSNATVVEERLIALVTIGDLDGATERLERQRESEPDRIPWHDGIAAFMGLERGQFDEAKTLLDEAIEADPKTLWFQILRARAAVLTEDDDAKDRFEHIVEQSMAEELLGADTTDPDRTEPDPGDIDTAIDALVHLGEGERAENLLRTETAQEALKPFDRLYLEGLIQATRGDVERAGELLRAAVMAATVPDQIRSVPNVEFPALQLAGAGWPRAAEMAACYRSIAEHEIPARLAVLDGLIDPERDDELLEAAASDAELASIAPDSEAEWRRVGATVVLARLHRVGDRLREAADRYRGLLGATQYPEAEAALAQVHHALVESVYESYELPILTPIALEVSEELTSFVEGSDTDLDPDFQRIVNSTRERIAKDFAVRMPGIRVRAADELSGWSYRIKINEVAVGDGALEPGRRLLVDPGAETWDSGMDLIWAADPRDGSDAAWIAEQDVDQMADATVDVWEVMEYPMRHIESAFEHDLARFVGHHEIVNMAEDLDLEVGLEDSAGLEQRYAERLRSDPEALGDVTVIARRLVEEMTPLHGFKALVDEYLTRRHSSDLLDLVEQIRMLPEFRRHLRGASADWDHVELDAVIEERFAGALVGPDGDRRADVEPDVVAQLLDDIRLSTWFVARPAIIVRDHRLRRAVRDVVQLEFFGMPVLSERELDPEILDRIDRVVDIDDNDRLADIDAAPDEGSAG